MFLSKDFVFQVVQIEYISPKNEFVLLVVVAELGLYRYSFWDTSFHLKWTFQTYSLCKLLFLQMAPRPCRWCGQFFNDPGELRCHENKGSRSIDCPGKWLLFSSMRSYILSKVGPIFHYYVCSATHIICTVKSNCIYNRNGIVWKKIYVNWIFLISKNNHSIV